MAKKLGRKAILKVNGTPVAGVNTKNFSIDNTLVDVTDDYDQGLQTYLAEPGLRAVSFSASGSTDTTALLDLSLGNNVSAAIELDYGSFKVSGTFMIANYAETFEHATASTFTASFSSSGAVVKTA